jgi:hypothetical protein
MECYEGATMIKTYRGRIEDEGQEKINLTTNRGEIGYVITKFQLMQTEPGQATIESTVKIYKLEQSTIDNTVDFTDGDLLGVALWHKREGEAYPATQTVIFDREIFNQNIFISQADTNGTSPINYYLELEQIKLNENESTMATLQSLRRFALPRN